MPITITPIPCGMIQANAYIVQAEGREDCVVVDPGDDYPELKRALAGRRVGAILLTHGHFDHIQAAGTMAEDTGAPVYAAAADLEMLNDPRLNGYADLMGVARRTWHEIQAQPYPEALTVCALEIQVLPTPGHSKGSVCLYLRDEAVLFSGDTLFEGGYGRTDLYGGDSRALLYSMKQLFALPPGVAVYPGHGGATTIGEERARYLI